MKYVIFSLVFIFPVIFIWAFFEYLPDYLPKILDGCFGVTDANAENVKMQNFGLVGDSFGIYNALFSALALYGVLLTLAYQSYSTKRASLIDRFYKMLDYHNAMVLELSVAKVEKPKTKDDIVIVKGRRVFVQHKIQIKYLLNAVSDINIEKELGLSDPDIADIAYAIFYYGANRSWKPNMLEYLKDYKEPEMLVDAILEKLASRKYMRYALDRTNQNDMSVYHRNMYNAIKIINSSWLLSSAEKKDFVKILRSQLSNAELYVLFFNLVSRFGKKWVDNDFVEKYQLIQNLPSKYCDGYDPKEYFKKIKFEGEEKALSPFREIIGMRE